ncbi:hypothetical protein M0802_015501 [Mischocyttarus mexicanus]|nr:hypothetical protein M0802_015501 [Mischocyttarus mexicanus]
MYIAGTEGKLFAVDMAAAFPRFVRALPPNNRQGSKPASVNPIFSSSPERFAAGPPVQLEPVDLSVKTPVVLQVPRYNPAVIISAAARRVPSPSTTPTPPPASLYVSSTVVLVEEEDDDDEEEEEVVYTEWREKYRKLES